MAQLPCTVWGEVKNFVEQEQQPCTLMTFLDGREEEATDLGQ